MSFLLGLFLLGSIVGPAAAFVPLAAGAVVGGTVMRTVVGGVAVRVGLPLAESVASKIAAANVLGVIGTGMVVLCGNNYLNGNDCSGQPLAKLRPANQTGNDSETATTTIPATQESQAAQQDSISTWRQSKPFGCGGGVYEATTTLQAFAGTMCNMIAMAQYGGCSASGTGTVSNIVDAYPGQSSYYCQSYWNGSPLGQPVLVQPTRMSAPTTGYSCPAGWTVNGTNCVRYTCPSGGTLSGTNCTLAQAVWAPDGTKSFRASPTGWVADPLDPDSTGETLANPLTQTVQQPNGQPAKVSITANPDGSITTQTWAQKTGGSGTTQTVYNSYTLNSQGAVTTATTNIYEGDISTVVNMTPAPTQQLELPTDYARENTVAQIKPEVTKAVDELKKINTDGVKVKEDGTPASEALDAGKTAYNDAAKAREDALSNVTSSSGKSTSWSFSLSLPTSCSPLSVDMTFHGIGRVLSIDPCSHIATIHELMSMIWAATTLFLVVGMFGRTLREV